MQEANGATLTPDELAALACVLDTLIPPSTDGRLPGAGELGLAKEIGATLRSRPDAWPLVAQGLSAFRELVGGDGTEGFAARPIARRTQLLNDLSVSQPALVPTLLFNTYAAYYGHPRIARALGIEAWPPHPTGYAMEPVRSERLDAMRRRKPIYRDV